MVSLMLTLSGCSTKVVQRSEAVAPPFELLQDCEIKEDKYLERPFIDTAHKLDNYITALEIDKAERKAEQELCNQDKAALRAFYNKIKQKEGS